MAIDWGALLPAQQDPTPKPAVPAVQMFAPGTKEDSAGERGDREAWEERAAIIEFEGGQDRHTAEVLATAEERTRGRLATSAASIGDDRRACRACGNYQDRHCTIAKPGGLVSAARGYTPVPDIPRRCEGLFPLPEDPDQRPGVERWPWLLQPSGQPRFA